MGEVRKGREFPHEFVLARRAADVLEVLGPEPTAPRCRALGEGLEGLGDLSICVRDVPKVGGWNIYTEDGEWVTDESFEVKCVED